MAPGAGVGLEVGGAPFVGAVGIPEVSELAVPRPVALVELIPPPSRFTLALSCSILGSYRNSHSG